MDAGERATGRARVRALLIERANAAGLIRPRGESVDAHDAMLKRLAERLAYMGEDNLITLAELVIEAAQGVRHNIWPCEASVVGLANGLEQRPLQEHRIVRSWLASVEGPQAVAGGFEVELYQFLGKHRRPPLRGYDARQIEAQARDNRREVKMVRDRIARDVASDQDRDWLQWYIGQRQHVRAIIEAGKSKRAAA